MKDKPDLSRLMQGVIPYLAIDGAEKAAAFYTKAFGAIQHGDAVKNERGTVMNLTLEINGGALMLMDLMPEIGTPEGEAATAQGMTMQLVTDQGDLWWNRAVAAGCEVTHPFQLEFWGDRYGRLRDPFGLAWAINEPGEGK
jgi:uncharacterized glyoxalase superfamily protein PhnB